MKNLDLYPTVNNSGDIRNLKLNSSREKPPMLARNAQTCVLLTIALLLATACASGKLYQVELMPAPEIYANGTIDPFVGIENIADESAPYRGILYATDRKPADQDDYFYENARGSLLRLGLAYISLGESDLDWKEARRISLLKNRSGKYPLKVTTIEEFGILDRSVSELQNPEVLPSDLRAPAKRFTKLINAKLDISRRKEVLIYVHGYKVVFDNPVLVTTELWHFLGYDGVAVAFAWPSTPSTWAYMSDLETAALSAHSLRLLIQFLAEETDAERINIIGYSAGTRVVIDALDQLALMHTGEQKPALQRHLRIGQVVLVGSDYDRELFGASLINGLLKVPERLTIYLSEADQALSMSSRLFGRNRLGQVFTERPLKPHVDDYLRRNDDLVLIDVTNAEAATAGNGHAYFRKSPWVSSDIFVSLLYRLQPTQRGLVRLPDLPVWSFPADYHQRLQALIAENYSIYRESLRDTTKTD
jgi:esterase/lipase superfamily enzyme